jgi:hypothetical protein
MDSNKKENLRALVEYELSMLLSITCFSILLSIIASFMASYLKVITLFFGVEGSILLAFALKPSWEASQGYPQKGFRKKISWWITEGSKRQVLINFNPIVFYSGLIFLLISILLSALN